MKAHHVDGISFFRFHHLSNGRRLQHAVFTREGGVSQTPFASLNMSLSVPDPKANVYANRARAYRTHGRDNESLVHAHLVHGAKVVRVTAAQYGQYVGPADGLITDEPGCGLAMNYADCAPIFLYDPRHEAIGLGHAGWQGAIKDLPGAMVRAMVETFGSRPEELEAAVGPCIGPCCYEVGEPVIGAVAERFEAPERLLVTREDNRRPHFDLPEANRLNLARAGVSQIELSGLCTACRTDLFFSHRAEKGRTGRFGTVLILGDG